jgi:phosphopantothenate---cysteine ligase (CTP)
MHCIVTAGPTYEPLDHVRRLTNFSTGRLGCELANHLVARGHEVTLLLGEQATWRGDVRASQLLTFTTTASLRALLERLSQASVGGVFHAAAVSDFAFGKVWARSPQGELQELRSGKISTRQGTLMAELIPTPKLIGELRRWFPKACLTGWKYEVEGDRESVLALAEKQLAECRTDACIANGPAYGLGFGLVHGQGTVVHLENAPALFTVLERLLTSP